MKEFKPRDKLTQRMTRDGAVLDNQTTGEEIHISERDAEKQLSPDGQPVQMGKRDAPMNPAEAVPKHGRQLRPQEQKRAGKGAAQNRSSQAPSRFSRRAAAPFPISRRIFQRPPRRAVQRKSSLTVQPQSMTRTRRGRQRGCPATRRSSGILHPVCSFPRKNALRRSCTSISTVRKRPPTSWMRRRQRSPRNGCCARSVFLMKPAAQPRPNCALIPWISPRPS